MLLMRCRLLCLSFVIITACSCNGGVRRGSFLSMVDDKLSTDVPALLLHGDYAGALDVLDDLEDSAWKKRDYYSLGRIYKGYADVYHSLGNENRTQEFCRMSLNALGYLSSDEKGSYRVECCRAEAELLLAQSIYTAGGDKKNALDLLGSASKRASIIDDDALKYNVSRTLAMMLVEENNPVMLGRSESLYRALPAQFMQTSDWCNYSLILQRQGLYHESDSVFRIAEASVTSPADSTNLIYGLYLLSKEKGDDTGALCNLEKIVQKGKDAPSRSLYDNVLEYREQYLNDKSTYFRSLARRWTFFVFFLAVFFILCIAVVALLNERRAARADAEIRKRDEINRDLRLKMNELLGQMAVSKLEPLITISQSYREKRYSCTDQELMDIIKAQIDNLDKNPVFYTKVEDAVNQYKDNLMVQFRKAYPALNSDNYRFISLCFAGFSNSTIAFIIRAGSPSTVKVRRHRWKVRFLKDGHSVFVESM